MSVAFEQAARVTLFCPAVLAARLFDMSCFQPADAIF